MDRLLPPTKNSFSIQGRMTEEGLRQMERDLKVNMSSQSYVLWGLEFALLQLKEIADDSQD